MKDKLHVSHLTFDGSATYQIWVGGHVESKWSDWMEGMTVHRPQQDNGPAITLLEGELIDQAALAGLLNTLYEMHLVVLSVECVNVSQQQSPPAQQRHFR
jgi:hypothetical protein